MKFRLVVPLALVLAVGILVPGSMPHTAHAEEPRRVAISFTPQTLQEENIEGPNVERTYFLAGNKKIVFGVPKDCRISYDGNGLLILPANTGSDAQIRVINSSFSPELDLAENALKFRESASQTIPKGATDLVVQQPQMNPYPYNGWKSLGFIWTYVFYGRPMHQTVSYINLEVCAQVVVTTQSAQTDAEKVDKIAHGFMSSWWVMGANHDE